jgi:hypothetical protein
MPETAYSYCLNDEIPNGSKVHRPEAHQLEIFVEGQNI